MASAEPNEQKDLLKQTQGQVNEVTGIARDNIIKLLEKDGHLTVLDKRAEELQASALQFDNRTKQLKRRYWWQNMRMNLIFGTIGIAVLILILWLIFRK